MSKTFKSLLDFSLHLAEVAVAEYAMLQLGLEKAAKKIEKTAKSEIGHYQPAVGKFPAWQELADSTKRDRVSKGYSENDPLLRDGEMRDSITHKVEGLEAAVGSDSDIMVWQELGTPTIPARPSLGPAAFRNKKAIKEILGEAAVVGILGGKKLTDLGHNQDYNFDTTNE